VQRGLGFARVVDQTEGRDAVHAQDSWLELEDDLTGGPHLLVSNERGRDTLSGLHIAGPRAESGSGLNGSPSAFSSFFVSFHFSFSVFPISFILLANLIQFTSNHFQKFCKIHSNVLNQYETCFQKPSRIFN
jgi:hypothetical protein